MLFSHKVDKTHSWPSWLGIKRAVRVILLILFVLTEVGYPQAAGQKGPGSWDTERYIGIDDIQSDMEAYCLTVYSGTKIERFELKVVSVVRGIEPGRDAILVEGVDERFVHTGPVAGCSGSPVYIDGRLAGALAFGWPLSKDPLYGVTPIREMLNVGQMPAGTLASPIAKTWASQPFEWDYSQPLDFEKLQSQLFTSVVTGVDLPTVQRPWPCPLMVSGLGESSLALVGDIFRPYGFMAVPGAGLGKTSTSKGMSFRPGSTMMVPLVDGDIRLAILGTVTEVADGRIYGFGHSFLGQGAIAFPLATGEIHTVVSTLSKSFKLGSLLETVGTLTSDEPAAVVGVLGQMAETVPVTLHVDHSNHPGLETFSCQVVMHQALTVDLLKAVIMGAATRYGAFPADHTSAYRVTLSLSGERSIRFENTAVNDGLREMLGEVLGSIMLLQLNPYQNIGIEGLDVEVHLMAQNRVSYIKALEVPDVVVSPGEVLEVAAVVETYRAVRQRQRFSLPIPGDLAPGRYRLMVCGSYAYQDYLRRRAPYRFMARDIPSLLEALDYVLGVQRNRLYCLLEQPVAGMTIESVELPHFPMSRALVLKGAKKTVEFSPYRPWLEQSMETQTVAVNQQDVLITVQPKGKRKGLEVD